MTIQPLAIPPQLEQIFTLKSCKSTGFIKNQKEGSQRGVWPWRWENSSSLFPRSEKTKAQGGKKREKNPVFLQHTHLHTHLSLKGKEAALHLCLRALKALNVASLPGLSPALSCAVNTHYDTGHPSTGNAQLSASGTPRNLTRDTLLTHCCPDTGFISASSIFQSEKLLHRVCLKHWSISSFYMHELPKKYIFIRMTQKEKEKKKS